MLAVILPTTYAQPASYQLGEVEYPVLTTAKEVIIKAHAASVNPIDVKKANGALKFAVEEQ